jgi:hypothetical protein
MNRAEFENEVSGLTPNQAFKWLSLGLNGWQAVLISKPSANLVRLQTFNPTEEESRCFHGRTLYDAFKAAQKYTDENPSKEPRPEGGKEGL